MQDFLQLACERYSVRKYSDKEIEDEKLLSGLMRLSENDLEMITYLVFDGYSQVEIAEIKGVSQPSISKKIKKIRKILNDF